MGGEKKSFQDLKIWQVAMEMFEMVCEDVSKWPRTQISRAIEYQVLKSSGSMGANVAEGYGRGVPGEFEQFLRYGRGSSAETEDWLLKAQKQHLISSERLDFYQEKILAYNKMVGSFIRSLRTQTKRNRRLDS